MSKEFNQADWQSRYRKHREKAAELRKIYCPTNRAPEPIDPDDVNHPWLVLMREEADLQAELPPAKVPTPLENAIVDLEVAVMMGQVSKEDLAEMGWWQGASYAGTPTFENPQLREAAATVIKWRDRAAVIADVGQQADAVAPPQINVTVNPLPIDFQPTIVVQVAAKPDETAVPTVEPAAKTAEPAESLSAEDRAIAWLAKYPGTSSIGKIAELADCSRQHLSNREKCPKFMAIWDANQEINRGNPAKGSKGKDGTVESWE